MNRPLFLLLSPSLLVAVCSAQQPNEPTALAGVVVPIHAQADDEGVAYGLWAAGDGYKASFHDGAVFVPYLGSEYPHNLPLRWRTTSATVGGEELVRRAPRLRHTDTRAEFDLGGIVEAWDVRADGLEQTFVLRTPPRRPGPLVVRGEVATPLTARARPVGHEPVVFEDAAGRAIVRYGAATAVDANGRTRAMATQVDGDRIELRLDGDWLASAAFPVVVDPLLSPVLLGTGGTIEGIDVALDQSQLPNYLAESRYASASDVDLRLWRLSDGGGIAAVEFADVTTQWSTFEPSLGKGPLRVLMAFTREFAVTGTRRVRLHSHLSTVAGLQNTVFVLDNPDGRNRWRPSVGSDDFFAAVPTLLVVYQVEGTGAFGTTPTSEVHGALVDLGAAGGSASVLDQFVVADLPLTDCERPCIASASPGPGREWTVAYQTYLDSGLFPNGLQWDVRLVRIDDAGGALGSMVVPGGVDQHQLAPRVAGRDSRFMAFYTESSVAEAGAKPIGDNGHRVRGVRVDWLNGAFVIPHQVELLQSDAAASNRLGGAAFDPSTASHWAVTTAEAGGLVRLRTCGFRGKVVTEDLLAQVPLPLGTVVPGGVSPTSDDGFQCGYGLQHVGGSFGVYFQRRPWPLPIVNGGGGGPCTPTPISWYGSSVIGTELCGVRLDNMPAGGFGMVAVATASASLQLFGIGGVHDGCWLLVPLFGPDHLGMLGPAIGPNATFPLPIPETVPPTWLRFQGIVFDPSSGELFSTLRLSVQVDR